VERQGAEGDDAGDGGKDRDPNEDADQKAGVQTSDGCLRQSISCIARPPQTCRGAAPLRFVCPAAVVAQSVSGPVGPCRSAETSFDPERREIRVVQSDSDSLASAVRHTFGRRPPRTAATKMEHTISREAAFQRRSWARCDRWPAASAPGAAATACTSGRGCGHRWPSRRRTPRRS